MTFATLILVASLFGPSSLDRVKSAAHGHKVTMRHWYGQYWCEVEGQDAFGIGATPEQAAADYLFNEDMMRHEQNPPHLQYYHGKQMVCPNGQDCN